MAKNYYQDGTTLDWGNKTDKKVLSGQPVIVGNIVGIALGNIAAGAEGVLKMSGVFVLNAIRDESWAQGAKLYLTQEGLLTLKADDGDKPAVKHAYAGVAWTEHRVGDDSSAVRLAY
ncbi:DUF2190 family protein [Rosenbergiella collisarenosi]|uniref:DUF2190 family protein n=1 Tax=Rosenbergiella collisarenosi TaxID=1544695 RepID=UPI001BDB5CE8|nr:DUF2190 family protein [Rosenbergiella collisarenosi]MBT0721071.1 DUF2190 family protein [Rosenbergiella collisarenosi]